MGHRGRPKRANPKREMKSSDPARRPDRIGPTKEHLRQRRMASGSEHVAHDYPLDVLLELHRRQDTKEKAERQVRGEPEIDEDCRRGIDEYQHAAGWALWRLRWRIQGEVGTLPNSVDKAYARLLEYAPSIEYAPLIAPADGLEYEEQRELTDEEREEMMIAARRAYDRKLRALDRIGPHVRRVVLAVCIDHEPCLTLWKQHHGDNSKISDLRALRLGLDAIGAAELRELDRKHHPGPHQDVA